MQKCGESLLVMKRSGDALKRGMEAMSKEFVEKVRRFTRKRELVSMP
jgi:hypothetical protein